MERGMSTMRKWRIEETVFLEEGFGGDECDVNSCEQPVEVVVLITDGERRFPIYLCFSHWRRLTRLSIDGDFSIWRFLAGEGE